MILQLDMENLKLLDDGRIATAFQQEVKHVVLDLMDRPGDKRPREVSFKVKFKPIVDDTGDCEAVQVQVDVGSKMPSRKSRVYDMRARKSAKGPMLVFNEDSLDNADQMTIFDDTDDTDE